MSIYDRVKTLCDEKKMSMRQLSANCGFSPSSIGKWKHHTPSAEKVQIVADYFGVSTDWLNEKTDVRNYEQEIYYTDDETADKAQGLSDKQRTIMSAVPHLKPKQVDILWAMVEQFGDGNE